MKSQRVVGSAAAAAAAAVPPEQRSSSRLSAARRALSWDRATHCAVCVSSSGRFDVYIYINLFARLSRLFGSARRVPAHLSAHSDRLSGALSLLAKGKQEHRTGKRRAKRWRRNPSLGFLLPAATPLSWPTNGNSSGISAARQQWRSLPSARVSTNRRTQKVARNQSLRRPNYLARRPTKQSANQTTNSEHVLLS